MLAELGAGEYFGEMALINHMTRTATVRCLEPMDVICLPKHEFSVLTAYLPEMKQSFEQVITQRRNATSLALAQRTNQ